MGSELARQANARTVLDKPTLQAFEEAAADERYKGKDARVRPSLILHGSPLTMLCRWCTSG